MFKSWIGVDSSTHCLFYQPAPPVASMASYCGTSFFHYLLIYYQNFCADAARICREFHCMYTPNVCNFMTLLDRKKSVHLEENSTCSQEDPTDNMSPPVSIYVWVWVINTLKAQCKPFGWRISTKWNKVNCTDKMLNFSLRRFTCSSN
jgi:hypothetical protein